jgi:hypothetical protein
MRKFKGLIAASAIAAGLLSGSLPASAYVLDFSGDICSAGPCSNYALISQSYGDVAGIVDVTYTRNVGLHGYSGVQAESSLFWNAPSYSGLPQVTWGDAGQTTGIFLKPLTGYTLTLNSFVAGSYQNANRTTQFTILDAATNAALLSTGPVVQGAAPTVYSGAYTSTGGIKIQWGPDGFDVGITNINFDVTPISAGVPEPSTWAMMIIGLAGLGFVTRRKEQRKALASA